MVSRNIKKSFFPNLFVFSTLVLISALHWFSLPQTRMQIGTIDPYLYTSLSLDYKEMLGRFGTTYYASRVAAIFPMALFYKIFGPEQGFILLRILVSTLTGFGFFHCLKTYWNWQPSLFLSGFLIISPWLTRELAWDYITGISVCYLVCGFAFIQASKKCFFPLLAGIFLASAINTNFAAIPYVFSFLICLFLTKTIKKENSLHIILLSFFGFITFYVSVGLFMWLKYPVWGPCFEWKSIETTLWLLKGGFERWHRPIWEHLNAGSYYIFTPFLVLSALIFISHNQKNKDLSRDLLLHGSYLIFTCLILLYLHYIKKGVVFWHMSFIYALPATYFGIAQVLGLNKIRNTEWKTLWPWVVLGFAFILFHAPFWKSPSLKYKELVSLSSIGLTAIGLLFIIRRPCLFSASLFVLGLTFLPFSSLQHQSLLLGNEKAKERDVIKIGTEVMDSIKKHAPYKKGKMALWVPIPESAVIRCITAMNFWGYSMIHLKNNEGLPNVGEEAQEKISSIRYLVVASDADKNLIQKGLINLRNATGVEWMPIFKSQIQHGACEVELVIAEKNEPETKKME
jgi:hypothetical protein